MMQQIDVRNMDDLQKAVTTASMILEKTYLNALNSESVQIVRQEKNVLENSALTDALNEKVRFYDVTQIVLNKNENSRDKLVSVYNAVGSAGASLLMMIHGDKERVSIKFGVKAKVADYVSDYGAVLQNSLKGNFPGTKIEVVKKDSLEPSVISAFPKSCYVASITDVSGVRSEEESRERQFMQGVEKLIDAMQGKAYTMLLIADPVSLADLNASRRALENLYSSLVPFSESNLSVGTNETDTINQSITKSVTDTVSESVTDTVTHTIGKSESVTDGTSMSLNLNGSGVGAIIGTAIAPGVGTAIGGMIGSLVSGSFGKNHSKTVGTNESDSNAHGVTSGASHSEGASNTEGTSQSIGSSQNLQIKFENHAVKQIMARIDKTLERYDRCADVGMWNCAMYCIAESPLDAQMAANVYHSIIRGKDSSLENGGVTVWGMDKAPLIVNSLKNMCHPFLRVDGIDVTPGTLISSSELAIHAGLPNHSVPGLPVLECAEFGRAVSTYDEMFDTKGKEYFVDLGKIWHMNQEEELTVKLNPDSLASHAFITGSTGSGKSNTVYQMLSELSKKSAKFLVVEPAKGEYKNIFSDARVYGTNPDLTPLLRINPFSFPHENEDASKNIHILEHLDRLIEIFCVCWPMYAAMPAVLKEAVEKSYEDCGWNLSESTNEYGLNFYPTFFDVTRNVRAIIDASEYDAENKGAYKGSLITRLKSLTNGINGLIFTTDEIKASDLFDENVIVDLSRVGSSETKSLIMGLLVLKLQEHRMTSGAMNASLRHVTVLEEAHNLLKRTSSEQSQDSGNLQGKSVEMLANAIAEMRTYGEGFIIADQAPALLDMAVIRNTNTKIIMRLPDKDDRELVGKAANLNDDQITELAKLPRGVAAVYQNEWVEPVLCKVERFDGGGKIYVPKHDKEDKANDGDVILEKLEIAKLLCNGLAVTDKAKVNELKKALQKLDLRASTKVMILKSIKAPLESPRYTKLSPVVSELFPKLRSAFVTSFARTSDMAQWTLDVDNAAREQIKSDLDEELLRSIRQCIVTDYLHNELGKTDLLEKWAKVGGVK